MTYINKEIQDTWKTKGKFGENAYEQYHWQMTPAITGKSIDYTQEHLSSIVCRNITQRHAKHDFIETVNGIEKRVEVKTDNGMWQKTGNIVLETYKKKYNTKGWFYTSDADYICFCLADKQKTVHKMLFLLQNDLRELVDRMHYKETNRLADGDSGYIVPIKDIVKYCKNVLVLNWIDDDNNELLKTLFCSFNQ